MSKDFEDSVTEDDTPEMSAEELERAYEEADSQLLGGKLDIRKEVFSQIALLQQLRRHLFEPGGAPKQATESRDIRSYLTSGTQLLTTLQKFEEALSTDKDFQRVEIALEQALEECPCPEFVGLFRKYLTGEESLEPEELE